MANATNELRLQGLRRLQELRTRREQLIEISTRLHRWSNLDRMLTDNASTAAVDQVALLGIQACELTAARLKEEITELEEELSPRGLTPA